MSGAQERIREAFDAAKEHGPEIRRGRLHVEMFADIEPLTAAPYLVKGILPAEGLTVVYGPPGCGKTFLASDLALHIALGWPWHGRKVNRAGIVYLAAEGGASVRNRLAAFRLHHDIAEAIPFALVPCPVNLRDPKAETGAVIEIVKAVAASTGIAVGLIVVDTLARAFGGGNENAAEDMGAFIVNLDRIRDETKAAIAIVHHSGKDTDRGARGHSNLKGAADTEIEVARDRENGTSSATVLKQRDLPDSTDPVTFRLEVVELGRDQDGDPVTSCVTVPAAGSVTARRPPLSGRYYLAHNALLNALHAEGRPAPDKENFPPNVKVVPVTAWLERLKVEGIIETDSANPRIYWKRIKEKLMVLGYVRIHGEFVWAA